MSSLRLGAVFLCRNFLNNNFEMAYNYALADRIRDYLQNFPTLQIEEKEMFKGLTFMVDGKMCVCVSDEDLMCRVDPALHDDLAEKPGFRDMVMKGKMLPGYCYIAPEGYRSARDFKFWVDLCLDFNPRAKASKKKKS